MDDNQQKETLFEKHKENIYFRWGLTAFVVIVACIIVAQFVTRLTSVFGVVGELARTLAPVLYGLGIAYLLDPIVERIQKFLQPHLSKRLKTAEKAGRLSRSIGVLCALIILILVIWALLSIILPQVLSSINTLVGNLPSYYNTLSAWVMNLIDDNIEMADFTSEIMEKVYTYFTDWLTTSLLPKVQSIVVSLTSSVVGMAKALINLVIGFIISIYLLMGKRKFLSQAKKFCYGILGTKKAGYVCNVCTFANQTFGRYIGGVITDSFCVGVLCFIGLQLMRMPYATLIAIIVGCTNIIPFFGPYLGGIPSALLLLVIDPLYCLYFIIFILVLQQVDGNILNPMILGDATGLSGFWVVVSILVFGSFYGVIGMIIAVPTFAVVYKIITELTNRLLQNKGLSSNTADYEAWNYPPRPNSGKWRRTIRPKRPWHRKEDVSQTGQNSPDTSDSPAKHVPSFASESPVKPETPARPESPAVTEPPAKPKAPVGPEPSDVPESLSKPKAPATHESPDRV